MISIIIFILNQFNSNCLPYFQQLSAEGDLTKPNSNSTDIKKQFYVKFCNYMANEDDRIYYLGRLRGDLCRNVELVNGKLEEHIKYFEMNCFTKLEMSQIIIITILYFFLLGTLIR